MAQQRPTFIVTCSGEAQCDEWGASQVRGRFGVVHRLLRSSGLSAFLIAGVGSGGCVGAACRSRSHPPSPASHWCARRYYKKLTGSALRNYASSLIANSGSQANSIAPPSPTPPQCAAPTEPGRSNVAQKGSSFGGIAVHSGRGSPGAHGPGQPVPGGYTPPGAGQHRG